MKGWLADRDQHRNPGTFCQAFSARLRHSVSCVERSTPCTFSQLQNISACCGTLEPWNHTQAPTFNPIDGLPQLTSLAWPLCFWVLGLILFFQPVTLEPTGPWNPGTSQTFRILRCNRTVLLDITSPLCSGNPPHKPLSTATDAPGPHGKDTMSTLFASPANKPDVN